MEKPVDVLCIHPLTSNLRCLLNVFVDAAEGAFHLFELVLKSSVNLLHTGNLFSQKTLLKLIPRGWARIYMGPHVLNLR